MPPDSTTAAAAVTPGEGEIVRVHTGRWQGRTLAASAAIAVLLAACGGGAQDEAASEGTAAAEDNADAEGQAVDAADARSADDVGGTEELVACAQEEGQLTLYTGIGESASRAWAEEFTSEYGIDVTVFRDGSNDLYGRWAQEVQSNRNEADAIIINTYQHFEDAASQGMLAEYQTQHVGDFPDDLFPEESELGRFVTPLTFTVNAVGVNSDLISEETRALLQEDPLGALLEGPEFQEGISMNTPGGGAGTGTFVSIVEEMDDQYGMEYLEQIAELPLYRFESGVPEAEALVAGEVAASFFIGDTILIRQVLSGAPIEFYYPKPDATGTMWMLGTPAETQHPCAARLLQEWAASVEGQQALSEHGGGQSAHAGWEDNRGLDEYEWYSPPENVWMGWRTHPSVEDSDAMADFNARILDALGI